MTLRLALATLSLPTLLLVSGIRAADAPKPAPVAAAAPAPGSLFDPERHMRVSEVRPGMRGYGLSVFSGTKIERFEVEVISVLKNFNPKYDVVLIRAKGQNLEHTGAVAGMSGSPIYLADEQGLHRMIGAFAYGWPLTKDPLAGVQPIEYMLGIRGESKKDQVNPDGGATTAEKPGVKPASGASEGRTAGARLSWSLAESPYFPGKTISTLAARSVAAREALVQPQLGDGAVQLRPLATPLMTSGVSPKVLEAFAPLFREAGLVPLQAGGGGAGGAPTDEPAPKLAPGSVLGVPMITGDMEMTALGTTTEVIGDRVFGFGHPFNNEGPVTLPMGSGRVSHIIPNLQTSFKLGALHGVVGRLVADQNVGVSGIVGKAPATVPIDIKVTYADGSPERSYHFEAASHPRFTALICGLALNNAITAAHDLPQYNTLDYKLKMEFANGRTLDVVNRSVNSSPLELFADAGMPLMAAADNPFERVLPKRVTGTIHVAGEARDAQVVEVTVPRNRFRPGELVTAFVTYKPFRAEEQILPVELRLPADLPEGNYQLVISDWRRYLQDEQLQKPFRFTAENVNEVFDVLNDAVNIRHNALYLRLMRQPDGVAVGRSALPQLPSSRRTVLLGAGRSTTSRFVSSTVKVIPTEQVMTGAAEFVIAVDLKAKGSHDGMAGSIPDQAAKPATPTRR